MKGKRKWLAMSMILILALAGCGGAGGGKSAPASVSGNKAVEVSKDPLKLSLFVYGADISDEELNRYYLEPLQKVDPNLTLQIVRDGKGQTIQDLLATGTFPDLIYTSNASLTTFKKVDLLSDLNPIIKKSNFDLNRFDQNGMDAIKAYGDHGEVYAVPFSQNVASLIYNKDIFDKFAVSYPKDGMTYDDVYALSQKLTRKADDVQYIGFDPYNFTTIALSLSLPFVDPKTNKSIIDNDDWKRVYSLTKQFYDIPGFIGPNNKVSYGQNGFAKDRTMAMYGIWASSIAQNREALSQVNWDVVQLPNFKEQIGRGREVDLHLLAVSSTSQHKEDALQRVIARVTSDEFQMNMSRNGRITVLKKTEIQSSFGADVEMFKGKNVQAIYKLKSGAQHPLTKYDTVVSGAMNGLRNKLAIDKLDVNTFARTVKEAADKAIDDDMAK